MTCDEQQMDPCPPRPSFGNSTANMCGGSLLVSCPSAPQPALTINASSVTNGRVIDDAEGGAALVVVPERMSAFNKVDDAQIYYA